MLKILLLAANPQGTNPLRLDEEMRTIKERLRLSDLRDQFVVEQEWAVRVVDLQDYLLHHQPHIVHFSGHGSQTGEIILEDQVGRGHPVSPDALKRLFATLKDNIRCVVLNACYSEVQAKGIARSIDCIVGMGRAIGDEAAIAFASGFYQALGYGRSVQTAFDLGCGQIDLQGLGEEATPKLRARRGVKAADTYLVGGREGAAAPPSTPPAVATAKTPPAVTAAKAAPHARTPGGHFSCFISYSHKDEAFAQKLHSRMRAEDIEVWYAPEDVAGGQKLHEQIGKAIQEKDKLLLVLSEHSMDSEWVMTEIRNARKAEVKEGKQKLFPIRLVGMEAIRSWHCFDADSGKDMGVEVREYFIPDFSSWQDDTVFERTFDRLVQDMRAAD